MDLLRPARRRCASPRCPGRRAIVLGPGALARLPAQVARLGVRRPLVVTDAGRREGRARRAALRGARGGGRRVRACSSDVQPNPTERDAARGLAAFRAGGCDGFVAIGGGSRSTPRSSCRCSPRTSRRSRATTTPPAATATCGTTCRRSSRSRPPPGPAPRSAAPASRRSPDTGRKTVIFSPYLLPKVAICDPELTVGPAAARSPPRPAWTRSRTASRRTSRRASTRSPTRSRIDGDPPRRALAPGRGARTPRGPRRADAT